MERILIVNADDFGASAGVNWGTLECHTRGVLTNGDSFYPAMLEALADNRLVKLKRKAAYSR